MADNSDTSSKAEASPNSPQSEEQDTKNSALWFLVYDAEADRDYFFNIETEQAVWGTPEGLEGCTFRRFEELEQKKDTSEENLQADGWHYIDMTGQSQGPFQKEQLLEWRAHFPMNTPMWTTTQMNSESEADRSTKKATFLAEILRDEALLQKWQSETMDHEARVAPSAADYALYLEHPIDFTFPQVVQEDAPQSSEQAYADAVLAGLPPEDETVQLADLAKQSGTPLKDIVRFVDAASSDGTAQQLVVTDPYTGKMTAVSGGADESHQLYAEFGSWIDPTKMEEGLKKSAQYRREKLPSLWMKQVGYKKRTLPWQDDRYDKGEN